MPIHPRRHLILFATLLFMFTTLVAAPASADYPDGYSPIMPWRQSDIDVVVGETYDFGTRWGTCTPGLSKSAVHNLDVVISVDGTRVGPPAVSSRPINPGHEISSFSFVEGCGPGAHGETGWWVFWKYPLVFNDTGGTHSVTVTMTALSTVIDGAGSHLPRGWTDTGTIMVHVVPAP